ncbi:lectin c-type domain-containing protein [Ditylenchus destructor]|nr:lectin c-type domain-containing protein [Ditylenchus destructor]
MLFIKACVQVRNNEFGALLRVSGNRCFQPYIKKWAYCKNGYCTGNCVHFFSIDEMRPFLSKNVRFGSVDICIADDKPSSPNTSDHIATLESISHIWAMKNLNIVDVSRNESNFLNLVLGSPSVLQCHTLYISHDRKRIQMPQNPNIYSLYAINLRNWRRFNEFGSFKSDEILQLALQKASSPHSDTIFVLEETQKTVVAAMELIQQNFMTSEDCCRLRIIIEINPLDNLSTNMFVSEDVPEFCLQNTRTKEVLQLKHTSKKELVKGSYNHPQAQAHCTAHGGTLSSTHNEKENAFIRDLLDEEMKKTGAGGVYHIGMMFSRTYSNATGPVSSAVWMDGTPVDFGNPAVSGFEPGTSPWSDGKAFGRPAEPSGDGMDGKAPELCVAMIQSPDVNGDWSDVSCKSLANMVCKKKTT